MLAIFCLRLAVGMLACLLILPSAVVNPRFYRTHFLTALGLVVLGTLVLAEEADVFLWLALVTTAVVCFAGSMIYLLEGAPGSRLVLWGGLALMASCLFLAESSNTGNALVDDATAAAVLGGALSAMLMGHSYLIAPTMSLVPLLRLLAALAGGLILRLLLAGFGLWSLANTAGVLERETILWLIARWVIGFVLPLILCWMAWETTKIRSTQSATGILYVVVVLCFLGELTSQLLQTKTGFIL